MTCDHPAVLFFKPNLSFVCEKCTEQLVKVGSIDQFRTFCQFSGKKESEIVAGVFFYIKYYYIKLCKKLLKKK